MPLLRYCALVLMVGCCTAATRPAAAKSVTLSRILNDHLMHVVTTESAASVSRYVIDLRLKDSSLMTLSDLVPKAKGLRKEEGVLFIIDRSKAGSLSTQEEQLLPYQSAAVDASQVILYSKKASNRNAWEILISAPNEKWLLWELDRLCNSNLRDVVLDERGSVLDRYIVKRLLVVSTEGRQLADDWIRGQSKPGGDTLDWQFLEAGSWSAGADAGVDTVMLLDRQKLTGKSEALVGSLPTELQAWLKVSSSAEECIAMRQARESSKLYTYAVVAPSARHLKSALVQRASLESIPESVAVEKLHNLGKYGRLVIVVRSGDRSQVDNSAINDLGSKLNSSLSSSEMGFVCTSKQDLKELVFASIDSASDADKIDSTNLGQIRKKIGQDCALVVADLTAIDSSTTYQAKTPVCVTQPYQKFSDPQPTEPREPNPEETILFKGKKYRIVDGDRRNDPHFIEDYRTYKDKLKPQYDDDMRRWERKSQEYEDRRRSHDMLWSREVEAISAVRITGNLRIYDAANLGTDTAGQLLFSCSLSGEAQKRAQYKTDQVSVRGEESIPDSLVAPEAQSGVQDKSILSDAFEKACAKGLGELKQKAILPTDILNYVAPPVVQTVTEKVIVVGMGGVKLKAKPSGQALVDARDAAVADSYAGMLSKIKLAQPDAAVTEDDIKDKLSIVSEGWNAKALEYRVKVQFEGEVVVPAKQQTEAK